MVVYFVIWNTFILALTAYVANIWLQFRRLKKIESVIRDHQDAWLAEEAEALGELQPYLDAGYAIPTYLRHFHADAMLISAPLVLRGCGSPPPILHTRYLVATLIDNYGRYDVDSGGCLIRGDRANWGEFGLPQPIEVLW